MDEVKHTLLSYLATKAESIEADFFFKSKYLFLDELTSSTIGSCCKQLYKDGLLERNQRTHTPFLWRTKFFVLGDAE